MQHEFMVLGKELGEGDYDKRFLCLIPADDSARRDNNVKGFLHPTFAVFGCYLKWARF
jgi:hypothetical protein